MAKTYTIKQHHRGNVKEITGDMEYLHTYFEYLISCGASWMIHEHPHKYMAKSPTAPKSGKAFVNFLNKCVEYTQGGCYERDYYELAE